MPMSKDFDDRMMSFFKNYQDRGMKKWAGYFLSDHTAQINRDNAKKAMLYHKCPTMSQQEASRLLLQAYCNHYQVSVQLKQLDDQNNYLPDICGFVAGYSEDRIIIQDKLIHLCEINNILLEK